MVRTKLVCLIVAVAANRSVAEDWPAWRGPHGNGRAAGSGYPLQWSSSENVKWKVTLPGPGNSTPIVTGQRVWVSCAVEDGRRRSLICFDRQTGRQLWQQDVEYAGDEPTHPDNPYCSSSPVTDGELVVVWHGSAGLHAYDVSGESRWSVDLGRFDHMWGNASSPILYEDLVILNVGPGLRAFVIALDKQSGQERWRREIPEMVSQASDDLRGSWSTPIIARAAGRDQVVISLPTRLVALDPLNGSDIWSSEGLGELIYSSPLSSERAVVAMSGHHGPTLAVRPVGRDDVTESHRLWIHDERPPQRVGTGMIVDQYLFVVNEPGIAWCLELLTGEILWKQRLGSAGSWSSLSLADGRLYVNDLEGTTHVFAPDETECTVLARNSLEEPTRASLAFAGGQIFARTLRSLYCLETAP
jgi:outer membrane protein assembly factor BamB